MLIWFLVIVTEAIPKLCQMFSILDHNFEQLKPDITVTAILLTTTLIVRLLAIYHRTDNE